MHLGLELRVVVTGGAGFIGSHIVDVLRQVADEIIVIDDLSTGSSGNLAGEVDLIRHDLSAPETVSLIERLAPNVIVHAAAQVSVSRSTVDPAGDALTNVVGSVRVFEGARAAGTSAVVYVTTGGALYGEPRYLPCDEDHPIEPISPYGLSKWAAERYLALLAPRARRVVLRLSNVYGPRQDARGEAGVVSIFATRMLAGDPIEIHGDGRQTRDFVYVEDVAAAVLRSIDAERDMTLNIGSGVASSIEQLFASTKSLTGYDREPIHTAPRAGDVRDSVLDVRRAASELGWRPTVPLPDGLRRTIDWYRATRPSTGTAS